MQVAKLHGHSNAHLSFMCLGCGLEHTVRLLAPNKWTFNGDLGKPTLSPSVLVRSGHHAQHHTQGANCWCDMPDAGFSCQICHSFVRDGKIQYLNDCTHELAGQTIDLPEMEIS